jgi:methyl-accepting chemotaxis protein/methyl-accepting chemotaxis protein-1 (serine sensor receptor)
VPLGGKTVNLIDQLLGQLRELDSQAVARAGRMASRNHLLVGLLIMLALAACALGSLVVARTTRELKKITSELGEGAAQIASAARQVASSGQTLAQGSSEQAAALQETSTSSEEIKALTRKNTSRTEAAAQDILETSKRVEDANRHLGTMVASMNEINASSDKISKIIKVIDEIAFQTNILALNAAVEAARAGEAGMGFAVVADEVRNLSQRCAQAARDTAGLIDESISKSTDGKNKLALVEAAIGAITESTGKVRILVEEVNAGSVEQARGVEQVASSIAQMEKVTQSVAANAEESASASEELSSQSEAVRAIVTRLTGMVGTDSRG